MLCSQLSPLRDVVDLQEDHSGRAVRLLSFPDYTTAIGIEIDRALQGERDYGPEVMQLLYVANRYEWKHEILREKATGTIVICDRFLASSVAYGEAHGLDPEWLFEIQRHLPQPARHMQLPGPDAGSGSGSHVIAVLAIVVLAVAAVALAVALLVK